MRILLPTGWLRPACSRLMAVATLVVLAGVTSDCTSSSTHSTAPASMSGVRPAHRPAQPVEAFLASLVNTEMLGQFPLVYHWLDRSQRAHMPEGAFMDWELLHFKRNTTFVTARSLGARSVTEDGLRVVVVRMRITIAQGASESSSVRTIDAVNRGDHWTWLLPANVFNLIGDPQA